MVNRAGANTTATVVDRNSATVSEYFNSMRESQKIKVTKEWREKGRNFVDNPIYLCFIYMFIYVLP